MKQNSSPSSSPSRKPPINLSEQQLKDIKNLLACETDDQEWEHFYAETNCIINIKKNKKDIICPIKLHAIIPGLPFKNLCEMIIDTELRKTWDHLKGFEIIQKISEIENIIYTYVEVIFIL